MSNLARTLVAVPVALIAIGMFAATSRVEFVPLAEAETDASIVTDSNGEAEGEIVITIQPGTLEDGLSMNVRLENEDARRSLEVFETGVADPDASAQKVRQVAGFYRHLPSDCEDHDGNDWPELCVVRMGVSFTGKRDKQDDLRIVAELGSFEFADLSGDVQIGVEYFDLADDID